MRTGRPTAGVALAVLGLAVAGCQGLVDEVVGGKRHDAKTLHVTLIGKSSSNPVFLTARMGAEAAAKDLSEKHRKLDVQVDWRTPRTEDPLAQVERIRAAVDDGTDAIVVSCSDEAILGAAIDEAVARGVPVMTFDSDAPRSRRFAFYGPNDLEIGESVMNELAALLAKKGKVAVLAGNASAPNLQRRVEGVRRAAARYPGIEIVGVYTHAETAGEATAKVLEVSRANPDLAGWAMVGGWPLFGPELLDAIDPRKTRIVAVDALPAQFPYVEKGIAPVLLAQPTFKWGKVAVEKVVDKVGLGKQVPVTNEMKLIRVSKENLGGWARQLKAWGYPDVPERYLTYEAE